MHPPRLTRRALTATAVAAGINLLSGCGLMAFNWAPADRRVHGGGLVTMLWVGNPDWHLIDWWGTDCQDWNERVAPGRLIFTVQLVDEGRARLLTLRREVALAKPPAVDPFWHEEDVPCRWCADWGPICTAMYIDIRDVPFSIIQRMHP
jgi:hypothetical protein